MLRSFLGKLTPLRQKRIEQVGNVAIDETVLVLEGATIEDANIDRIQHQDLPSHRISEYIPVSVANLETGMSESNLRRIAREKLVEAIMVQRAWLLLRSSLEDYIVSTGYKPRRRKGG